jgi:hypothetical protein
MKWSSLRGAAIDIRHCFAESDKWNLRGMRRVLQLERAKVLWRRDFNTFEEVISTYKLCPVSHWRGFKRVLETDLLRGSVQTLGLDQVMYIASQPVGVQAQLVNAGTKAKGVQSVQWYRLMALQLNPLARRVSKLTKNMTDKQKISYWHSRCLQLENILRSHDLKVPAR